MAEFRTWAGAVFREWWGVNAGGPVVALLGVATAVVAILTRLFRWPVEATIGLSATTISWAVISAPIAAYLSWRKETRRLRDAWRNERQTLEGAWSRERSRSDEELEAANGQIASLRSTLDFIKVPQFADTMVTEARLIQCGDGLGLLLRLLVVNLGASSNIGRWIISASSNGRVVSATPSTIPIDIRRNVLRSTKFVHDVMLSPTLSSFNRHEQYRVELWAAFDVLDIDVPTLQTEFRDESGRLYRLPLSKKLLQQLQEEKNSEEPFVSDFPTLIPSPKKTS